jgi:hypothetical protein
MLAIGALPAQGLVAQGLAAQGDRGMRKGGKAAKWAARSKRLSVALRENLKRRKAQARGRTAAPAEDAAADDGDAGVPGGADSGSGRQPGTPDFRRNRSNE